MNRKQIITYVIGLLCMTSLLILLAGFIGWVEYEDHLFFQYFYWWGDMIRGFNSDNNRAGILVYSVAMVCTIFLNFALPFIFIKYNRK